MPDAHALEPDGGGKLLALDWHPPDHVVRQFGVIAAFMLPLLAWLWLGRPGPSTWTPHATTWMGRAAALGTLLTALGMVRPKWLRPLFVGLCLLAYPLGLVLSAVLLRAVYYGVFTPMALIFRLRGRDALRLRLDPQAETYWSPRPPAPPQRSYFRLF